MLYVVQQLTIVYHDLANFTSSYHQDQVKLESKTCFVTAVHNFNSALCLFIARTLV